MKRFVFLLFALCGLMGARSQLVVVFQTPPAGFSYKPQLWNMMLTNTGSTTLNLHIEVTLNALPSGQQVLSGVTRVISLPPGTMQLDASQLMPIQYNVLSGSYPVDASAVGLLPIGSFEACYHFFRHVSDNIDEIAEQCQEIIIEPLSPPQLIYPYDQTGIEELHPQFQWLPPVPVQLFNNLRYDLLLVEINPNQSAADAIQQNLPVYQGVNLGINSMLYPLSAPSLQYGKQYAWRVVAKSGDAAVGSSETWQFSLKQFGSVQATGSRQPYVLLKKDPETAYAIFVNELRFSYHNESGDTTWQVSVSDLSKNDGVVRTLSLDSLPLLLGQNLVRYEAGGDSYFIHRHLYQLELTNSRNEKWRLRFEYRRSENEN
ncbi:MAG TPA: hypothetical protein VFR58_03405 [Flavisolibacter sp.]|nr:hypothetical protein [Flavisolibacter sp.]